MPFRSDTRRATKLKQKTGERVRWKCVQLHWDEPSRGKRRTNVVPFPGSLEKSILPLCNCTIRKVMARPIPEPFFLVVK